MTETPEALVRRLCAELVKELPPTSTEARSFLGRQFDLGLAWVSFPLGEGGLGLPTELQQVVADELERAGAPAPSAGSVISYGMAGPTVLEHGSEAQRETHLRKIFTGEEIWCQLFSEPGAGSDLAALSTRAVRDGDD